MPLFCCYNLFVKEKQIQIIQKNIKDIHPYKNNPRVISDDAVEKVANSIKEFGFKVPLVIDKNGVIVTGHTRLKAAEKLEMDEVPCIVADDLTPEQIKAFRLVDNKVSEMSEWDFGLLDAELQDLVDIDFSMDQFGFENVTIDYEDDGIANSEEEDTEDDGGQEELKKPSFCRCPNCGFAFEPIMEDEK